ncbi:GntR family transcriptional regulator [Microbacterium karelineae]|uniref:GntR family transcriptional regulator n=1 Tax=Microbacterium karelineae TaxID=2654283 RepID=UPI0012E9B90E|nr:GntR family transcriptional regulator [Microbacterium karelineae]
MRTSDRVYEVLREEILEGILEPGVPLAEIEQSARLGVSRTPLREALGRLQSDGLVTLKGARGLIVSELSPQDVTELFEIREALEVKAARLAALHRDRARFEDLRDEIRRSGEMLAVDPSRRAFYEQTSRMDAAIDEAAANPFLIAALRGVRAHMARIRRLSSDDAERLSSATQEHLMIIDAIIEGSETMAAYATELHLHRSLASITKSLNVPPADAPPSLADHRSRKRIH